MSNTIDKQQLSQFVKEYAFESNFAKQLYMEIQSGRFDSDVSIDQVIEESADMYLRLQNEIQRLRAALVAVESEMADDTSPRAQRINRIISEALSDTVAQEPSEAERVMELKDALDKAILEIRIWSSCYGDEMSKQVAQKVVSELRETRDAQREKEE